MLSTKKHQKSKRFHKKGMFGASIEGKANIFYKLSERAVERQTILALSHLEYMLLVSVFFFHLTFAHRLFLQPLHVRVVAYYRHSATASHGKSNQPEQLRTIDLQFVAKGNFWPMLFAMLMMP